MAGGMMYRRLSRAAVFLCILAAFVAAHGDHGDDDEVANVGERLLVVSLDGFPYRYLARIKELVPDSALWSLIATGAYAPEGITSVFPTLTFPNHYSLVTGLHPESHGVVANTIYDPAHNKTVSLTKDAPEEWLYGGEPIWKTLLRQTPEAQRKNVLGCYMWLACDFGKFDNFVRYDNKKGFQERITTTVKWLKEGARMVLVYFPEPDSTGHEYGPNSVDVDKKLKEVDENIGQLVNALRDAELLSSTNLLVVSDHGMAEVTEKIAIPTIDGRPPNMFKVRTNESTMWLVEPNPGKENDTLDYFNKIPHLTAFEKHKTPEHWHYSNNDRISPIVVTADKGYALGYQLRGLHGYDNLELDMRPIFIANGPAFVKNSTVSHNMKTLDVYLLLCTLLKIEPAPNNGSSSYYSSFVKTEYLPASHASLVPVIVVVVVILLAVTGLLCHLRRRRIHRETIDGSRGDGYFYKPLPHQNAGRVLTTHNDDDDDDDFELP